MIVLSIPGRIEARILPFGATLQSLLVPDRNGILDDIVLGHDSVDGYLARRDFYGATIGRFANRIAGGRFGSVQIPTNDGPNALHGGPDGFDRRMWQIVEVGGTFATLELTSPDGDQGFSGTVSARITYLVQDDVLSINIDATTDKETPVNLTHHSFFNLGGNLRDGLRMRSVMDHELRISASHYLSIDAHSIPDGPPLPVEGTAFDFRTPRRIGERIRLPLHGRGYDHNFVLNDTNAAEVYDPVSGRAMQIVTDQPGLQFYSGNFLDGSQPGKGGLAPRMGDALCLEPQFWPDSPNRPDFPDATLRPGATYRHRTEFRFTTR